MEENQFFMDIIYASRPAYTVVLVKQQKGTLVTLYGNFKNIFCKSKNFSENLTLQKPST